MNVIPDTPIWSLVLRRRKPNRKIQDIFTKILEEGRVILPGIIKQELLSGIKHSEQFSLLAEQLEHFPSLLASDADHILAAKLYNKCQKSGIKGSHIDFLILALAVNNDFSVLTTDKDFFHYKKYIKFELNLIGP
jgi:predicted nucleic acid-binding protein